MYRIIKNILIIISIVLSINLYAITKPPYPPSTGSDTLDAINRFIHDTLWWQPGDSLPNTGSSTLNAIARQMMNIANHGCTGTSSDGSYTSCTPKSENGFGGSGAGGSWGGDGDNDPYGGNGGSAGTPNTNWCFNNGGLCGSPIFTTLEGAKSWKAKELNQTLKDCRGSDYVICLGSVYGEWHFFHPPNEPENCPERQILDPNTNQCVVDPNQCLSPYTLINGVCVPPKQPDPEDERCPYGYEKQGNLCIAKPSKGDCDPTIQNCDANNNSNDCSEICPRLDTIIRNQGTQIQQQNTTNRTLSEILAQQQTTNLKLDALGQKLDQLNALTQGTNANLQMIQQQLAVIEKLLKQGIQLDIEPILKKLDEIIANDNKNHQSQSDNDNKNHKDLTGLIAKGLIDYETKQPYLKDIVKHLKEQPTQTAKAIVPILASTVQPITNNQEKQIDLLEDIKDLLDAKDDKDNPLPDPKEPDNVNNNDYDPFGAIKGYNISQNRINAGKQCPADKEFVVMGQTFKLSLSYLCQFFAMLAPVFLSIAYFTGAKIVIKGLD